MVITLSKELLHKTVTEVAALIKSREVSPVELTQNLLDHAHELNDSVNAYISFRDEAALAEARTAEEEITRGNYRGPLHGIPMAIKDNIYIGGEVTTMASEIHGDFASKDDSSVVQKLREAGAVITGKLNMHEYAWGIDNNSPHFGAVHNPWNLGKVPGGSSGGSGAAVAADMSFTTLGTDTAGSIRIPSAACGLVGLKPTHGRVAKYGCFPLAWSLDHIGPMSKSVADAAATLQAIAGHDHRDPSSVDVPVADYSAALGGDPKNLVIGVEEDYFFRDVDSPIEELVRKQIDDLVSRGAKLKKISIPALAYSEWTELATSLSEASAIHHHDLQHRPGDLGADIRFLFELGELFSAVDYLQAQQVRRQIKQEFTAALQDVDVIIAPTLPVMAPDIGSPVANLNGAEVDLIDSFIRFTGPSNLTGLPALTVPVGLSADLPVGAVLLVNGLVFLGRVDARAAIPVNLLVGALLVLTALVPAVTLSATASDYRAAAFGSVGFLLFGFTYLTVGANSLFGGTGTALGWYCGWAALIAAVLATVNFAAATDPLMAWLWVAWSALFLSFFLALVGGKREAVQAAGMLAVLQSVTTASVPGLLMIDGSWATISLTLVAVVHIVAVLSCVGVAVLLRGRTLAPVRISEPARIPVG